MKNILDSIQKFLVDNIKNMESYTIKFMLGVIQTSYHLNIPYLEQFTRERVSQIESRIMEEYQEFFNDIGMIISDFLKSLSFSPHLLLQEMNKMQSLVNLNKYDCLDILEGLIERNYKENAEIYQKLLDQLKISSPNMNGRLVIRAISILSKLFDMKVAE